MNTLENSDKESCAFKTGDWSSAPVEVAVDSVTSRNLNGARLDMMKSRSPFASLHVALRARFMRSQPISLEKRKGTAMPVDEDEELSRLASIAADSWYAKGINPATIMYSAKVFSRHWQSGHLLEMGPAEGLMTDFLAPHFKRMTLVDGSEQFCDSLQRRFPKATVVHSLFEEFTTTESFDTIVLGHVLEHVDNAVELLSIVRKLLRPGGVICAAVPNSRSLHRQGAVLMGLLPYESALNETDRHHGHRRVYDPESLTRDFRDANLKVKVFGGYWIKPLSNGQLEAQWTAPMIDAFMQLGERYPDIAAEIYVIAEV